MTYRFVDKTEFGTLALIHLEAFKDFFLSDLGLSFLLSYYKAVLRCDGSIAVCALNNEGKILGFATGNTLSAGFNRKLLISNWYLFSYQVIRLILIRPMAILRLLRNLDKKPHRHDNGKYSELLSIAVIPSAKGTGVGTGLLAYFEEEARKNNCDQVALTTDYINNEQVIEFYKKNGYKIFYDFYAFPHRRMYKMVKELNNNILDTAALQ